MFEFIVVLLSSFLLLLVLSTCFLMLVFKRRRRIYVRVSPHVVWFHLQKLRFVFLGVQQKASLYAWSQSFHHQLQTLLIFSLIVFMG